MDDENHEPVQYVHKSYAMGFRMPFCVMQKQILRSMERTTLGKEAGMHEKEFTRLEGVSNKAKITKQELRDALIEALHHWADTRGFLDDAHAEVSSLRSINNELEDLNRWSKHVANAAKEILREILQSVASKYAQGIDRIETLFEVDDEG